MIGLIQHMMAHKIPIGFTEETDVPGNSRRQENSHGCKAMDKYHRDENDEHNMHTNQV